MRRVLAIAPQRAPLRDPNRECGCPYGVRLPHPCHSEQRCAVAQRVEPRSGIEQGEMESRGVALRMTAEGALSPCCRSWRHPHPSRLCRATFFLLPLPHRPTQINLLVLCDVGNVCHWQTCSTRLYRVHATSLLLPLSATGGGRKRPPLGEGYS